MAANSMDATTLTPAGQALRRYLADPGIPTAAALAKRWRSAPELASHAFFVAARRRFTLDLTADHDQFVRAILEADRSLSESRVQVGVTLLRDAIDVGRPVARVPARDSDILLLMLVRLVRDLDMDGPDLTNLTLLAEDRAIRMAVNRAGSPAPWRRWAQARFVQRVRTRQDASYAADWMPRSNMGMVLQARAGWDDARARASPDDRLELDGDEVVGAAFVAAVRRRFPAPQFHPQIVDTAARVAAAARSFVVSRADVVALIRSGLDGSVGVAEIDRETRIQDATGHDRARPRAASWCWAPPTDPAVAG